MAQLREATELRQELTHPDTAARFVGDIALTGVELMHRGALYLSGVVHHLVQAEHQLN